MSNPIETRALLFTDIEGSTRALAALGDAYASVLHDQRVIVRKLVAAYGGHEHSTEGDAFFLSFPSASNALAAAVEAQRELGAHTWPGDVDLRVRMGVHAGEISWTEDDDVVGMAIHEAARIAHAAHGGQIVVSSVARDLIGLSLPLGVSLDRLGCYRLRDVEGEIDLFQVTHSDLQAEFPPLDAQEVRVDLPVARTSFVGRLDEVDAVLRLLHSGPLTTVTGVGGAGKTRLAIEAARRDAPRYPDGVFFVGLAPIADPALVVGAIATAVSVQGDSSDVDRMLLTYLAPRRALIAFDNCEHLIDACADVVDRLLETCPSITVLATSREALEVEGEQTYRVPSLSAETGDSEAVRLFVERAQAANADFAVTPQTAPLILSLCRRLDGLPLAIELAAARVGQLGIHEVANRLDERFEILIGGRHRRAQRQQTLQAAIDWSWDLLDEGDRSFLCGLAVFSGSFTLAAAEFVCGDRNAIARLTSLVNKSLVNVDPSGTETRYHLLETVRLYAQDRLADSGRAIERRDAHCDYYVEHLGGIALDALQDMRLITRCLEDYGNHLAALDWGTERERTDVGRLALLTSLTWAHVPALNSEARARIERVAEDETQPVEVRAHAYGALAVVSTIAGRLDDMHRFAKKASAVADGRPYEWNHLALWALGRYDEAAAEAAEYGNRAMARWHRTWAAATKIVADPATTVRLCEEILREVADADPTGRTFDRWWALQASALARLVLDDGTGALADARAARELLSGFESWGGSLLQYPILLEALAYANLGDLAKARATLRSLVLAVRRDRYPLMASDCVIALAYMAYRGGDPLLAAQFAEPVAADARLRVQPMYFFFGRFLADLRRTLGADAASFAIGVRAFVDRTRRAIEEGEPPDAPSIAKIDSILRDFVEEET